MSEKHIYLTDLHNDHKTWLSNLELIDEEIKSFENRLGEVTSKNTSTDVLATLEHLQNSLIRHKEVSDELKHEINGHEQKLAAYAEANQTAIDRKYFEDHPELRDKMETEIKLFDDLKSELKNYLAEVM